MSIVFNKTICSLLTLLFVPFAAFALDTEYKNSLTKVEVRQASENAYDVNLYMQKKFTEPVKVIKKSDLNYYILLPETKNSASSISRNGKDIRDVVANSHKYAGADVNNGYTKINISTTKPVNFNINVKNNAETANSSIKPKIEAMAAAKVPNEIKPTEQNQAVEGSKVQKKNLDLQNFQAQQIILKEKRASLLPKAQPAKKTVAYAAKKSIESSLNQTAKKKTKNTLSQKQSPAKKVQKPISNKPIAKPILNEQKPVVKAAEMPQEEIPKIKQELQEQEQIKEPLEEIQENTNEKTDEPIENQEPVQEEVQEEIPNETPQSVSSFKDKFLSKITEYGLSLNDLIFMFFAGLFSLVALIVILKKPNQAQAKLKTKADLIGKLDKTEKFVPKKTKEPKKPQGQYFVFDKHVKQTAFCEPSTAKNYELSNYDPDINVRYGKEINNKESEYDIIQKILREDSLVEIAPGEFEPKTIVAKKEHKVASSHTAVKKEMPQQQPQRQEVNKTQGVSMEPKVLSSIEIAPERGFMCVSYNNNVNLMGYIFDDVFALYNFKKSKLDDTEIKFRLSDKDDKGTNFIVKVDNTKIVVRVTKSQMNLLVVM